MKQKTDKYVTKIDLQVFGEELTKTLGKKITDEVENAVGQISSAVMEGFKETNDKIDNGLAEVKSELKAEIRDVKTEVIDTKRRLTDLETDTPSEKTCRKHDLRISKLEKSVFASA